ncbi:unnamed protein product [Brassicogethes aeneus]|uniref:Helicase ATP-binding domain-containing protein n=1 Tax=Brassicogethes aeneus TaxID=1431903 RepID=A0A9P0BDK8_BRAAE|nr:unnamed protein product [Brassicogethes aeneus]
MSTINIRGVAVEFPFEPYELQREYMDKVIECLQNETNGVMESPTGTGKTLSLLCSTLGWLQVKKAQIQAQRINGIVEEEKQGFMGNLLKELTGKVDKGTVNNADNSGRAFMGLPTIIYASRTHTQLSQAINELKRSAYKHMKAYPYVPFESENAQLPFSQPLGMYKKRPCHLRESGDGHRRPGKTGQSTQILSVLHGLGNPKVLLDCLLRQISSSCPTTICWTPRSEKALGPISKEASLEHLQNEGERVLLDKQKNGLQPHFPQFHAHGYHGSRQNRGGTLRSKIVETKSSSGGNQDDNSTIAERRDFHHQVVPGQRYRTSTCSTCPALEVVHSGIPGGQGPPTTSPTSSVSLDPGRTKCSDCRRRWSATSKYISANSGARIDLAEEVKVVFKIQSRLNAVCTVIWTGHSDQKIKTGSCLNAKVADAGSGFNQGDDA